MILKFFELNKLNNQKQNFILFHGRNNGLKSEEIIKLKLKINREITYYEEKQIFENKQNFLDQILNKSLFEKGKFIVINRASDKIRSIVEELLEKNTEETFIVINTEPLDKKSKLRNLFEKDKEKLISVAFYPDTIETLFKLASNFLREKKIRLSSSNINFIINKCNGDRKNLINELEKIELFSLNKKNIDETDLFKLINLTENHSINELIDCCLAKNQKKTLSILNENVFTNEECIIITRTMLKKTKRLLNLINNFKQNKNIEQTIRDAKPPIFWKEKDITKQQISKWAQLNVEKLISEINKAELEVKKIPMNSINLITNFLLEKSK
ncbi:MAG: DNA polymerase III subunit delta [Candidatus Pelagibacter sp. TMED196]|nr:MAG: DNA polymerase III subunit delta [Candidatus Pelagibacter sp. TMED196]